MPIEVIELTEKHRQLLQKLCDLIPDMQADSPASLQRVFGLGLIALTMRVTQKAREEDREELVAELGALARQMVDAEGWDE